MKLTLEDHVWPVVDMTSEYKTGKQAAPGTVCPDGEGLTCDLCWWSDFYLVVISKGGGWICRSLHTEKPR